MSNESAVKQRQSGIELLKIIAMFGIVFFHCLVELKLDNSPFLQYVDFTEATKDISVFVLQILFYLGTLGNLIFLISSSWFLVDSKNFKFNKIAAIVFDVYVISVTFLLIFLGGGKLIC